MTSVRVPDLLSLELTTLCQLECVHCYCEAGPHGTHGSMTREDWMRVIDEAAAASVRRVQFIGGEPTLHPNLCELITHVLSYALAVEVFSNLVHVTAEQWRTFAQPGVSLATSYYSDDAEQHRGITGRSTYERTKANIATATKLGIPVRAGIIDINPSQRITQARQELMDLGVPRIGGDRLREFGRSAPAGGKSATELCGACGDGWAVVLSDGFLAPCLMAR